MDSFHYFKFSYIYISLRIEAQFVMSIKNRHVAKEGAGWTIFS